MPQINEITNDGLPIKVIFDTSIDFTASTKKYQDSPIIMPFVIRSHKYVVSMEIASPTRQLIQRNPQVTAKASETSGEYFSVIFLRSKLNAPIPIAYKKVNNNHINYIL